MNEWRDFQLGAVASFKKGINYTSSDYSDEDTGRPFITIKCFVKGGGYEPEGLKFIRGGFSKEDQLSEGDILFSVTDLTRAGDIVGSPLRVPFYGNDTYAVASMDCMRAEPFNGICDKGFLYQRMMLSDIRRQMVAYSAGSTVLHLDTKQIPRISARMPAELKIQQKIASILQTIDQTIEKTEALIEKYQHIKAGLMHDLFTRGIGADGKLRQPREQAPELYQETSIGWIPKEWKFDSLKNIFGAKNIVNGPFGSDLLTSELKKEGIPVLYCQDIKPGVFTRVSNSNVTPFKAAQLAFCNVRKNDILLAKVGSPPCDSCVYEEESSAVVTQDVIRIRPSSEYGVEFFSSWFNSDYGRQAIKKISIEGTRERVSLGEFKELTVPFPDIAEQIEIGRRISQAQKFIAEEKRNLIKLKQKKSSLMHDLLTGKVQVNVNEPNTAAKA